MRDDVPAPTLGELDGTVDTTNVDHEGGPSNASEEDLRLADVALIPRALGLGDTASLAGREGVLGGLVLPATETLARHEVVQFGRVRLVEHDADDEVDGEDDEDRGRRELEQDTRQHDVGALRRVLVVLGCYGRTTASDGLQDQRDDVRRDEDDDVRVWRDQRVLGPEVADTEAEEGVVLRESAIVYTFLLQSPSAVYSPRQRRRRGR